MTDTANISVVPPGRLAFALDSSASTIDLDGSGYRKLSPPVNGTASVAWAPDGSGVFFSRAVGIFFSDTVGTTKNVFPDSIPFVVNVIVPKPTADGQWLYFRARDSRCSPSYCFYRSRIDGTAPELIGTPETAGNAVRISPSPDGSQIAYTNFDTLRVFDVATKTASSWSQRGSDPRWSPDGTKIAFIQANQAVAFIQPDGTGLTAVPGAGRCSRIAWAPDSRYIIGQCATAVSDPPWWVIDTHDGTRLPLMFTKRVSFFEVDWR